MVDARKRTLGAQHPNTLHSMHNLAITYSEADRLEETLQLKKRVVEARKRALGKGHPNSLPSIDALSYLDRIHFRPSSCRQEVFFGIAVISVTH